MVVVIVIITSHHTTSELSEHHEHLVDVETGEVTEFYHAELEALKEQIAREMGYELVDHRLELFGRKLPKDAN